MIRHELRGAVGGLSYVWDLTDGGYQARNAAGTVVASSPQGPRVIAENVEGMGDVKVDVFGRETPRGAGRVRTGTRAQVRKPFLPIVFLERGTEWQQTQALFWSMLSPDAAFWWRVYGPDGTWRELECFLDPTDTPYKFDPSLIRHPVGLSMDADQPFWLGPEQLLTSTTQGSGMPFFGTGTEAGPPFYIEPSAKTGSTWVEASGDMEVWPVLTVVGPATGFVVEDDSGGGRVSSNITVPSGQKLVVDFAPTSQAAMLRPVSSSSGGTNVTAQLSERGFFPINGGHFGGNLVSLSMVGNGFAELSYRPKYRRAV